MLSRVNGPGLPLDSFGPRSLREVEIREGALGDQSFDRCMIDLPGLVDQRGFVGLARSGPPLLQNLVARFFS